MLGLSKEGSGSFMESGSLFFLALSAMADILPESDKYTEKDLCGWCAKHMPGDGTNCCYVPNVGDLGLGSHEKALRR